MAELAYDSSTIDWRALRLCDVYTPIQQDRPYKGKALTRLSAHVGSGCFMDPPGHPSYFVQTVETRCHNLNANLPTAVLFGYVVRHENDPYETWESTLERFYVPLPESHPRVQMWIRTVYAYFHSCYYDPRIPREKARADTYLCLPLAGHSWQGVGKPDKHAYLETHETAIMADTSNHVAVAFIRRWYPHHSARLVYIATPPHDVQEDWWERYAERPTSAECPGHLGTPHGTRDDCRLCGRHGLVRPSTA